MSSNAINNKVGRRSFIKGAAFGLGALALGGPLLTACGNGAAPSAGAGSSVVPLPTYLPQVIAKPDFKAPTAGVQNAWLRFPTDRAITVKGVVGSGKPVTAMTITYAQPPAPLEQNSYWQFMNKELNIDYKPIIAAANDFPAKFAATMAGGDIPDMVAIPVFMGLPRIPEMYKTVFQDLSEHLSGDAIKEYPNLANIDSETWKYCRVDGKIVGIPTARPTVGPPLMVRKDLFDQLGVSYNPKTADEFEAMCKAVTDPKANRYALSAMLGDFGTTWNTRVFGGIFGAPNNWKLESDGKLVRDIETTEFKDTVAFMKKLWDGGYWHPDSANQQVATAKALFISGNVLTYSNGIAAWATESANNPKIDIDVVYPFGAKGGKGATYNNRPLFSLTAVKKSSDKEHTKEMLRILNYLCAPFGSQENFNVSFGAEGKNYDIVDGVPKVNKTGQAEMGVSISRLGNGPQPLFSAIPIDKDIKRQFDYQVAADAVGMSDPTMPYWPITVTQMTSLEKALTSGITDVVTGRQPLSSLDEVAKTWRTGGGDELRKKYEDAIAADK